MIVVALVTCLASAPTVCNVVRLYDTLSDCKAAELFVQKPGRLLHCELARTTAPPLPQVSVTPPTEKDHGHDPD